MKGTIPQIVHRRKRRSVKLASEEIKQLKAMRKGFDTDYEFAVSMSMDQTTLMRIIEIGRASEDNANKIREVLTQTVR